MDRCAFDGDKLKSLAYEIYKHLDKNREQVFVCIGCDKYVCDSLAPIVAEYLKNRYNIRAYVYGGLGYNITASNLVTALNFITTQHPKSQVIVVDAMLGEKIGDIKIKNGCYPAGGRVLPVTKSGDFSLLGVVGKKSGDFNLNSTRLQCILDMAGVMAKAIAMAMYVIA